MSAAALASTSSRGGRPPPTAPASASVSAPRARAREPTHARTRVHMLTRCARTCTRMFTQCMCTHFATLAQHTHACTLTRRPRTRMCGCCLHTRAIGRVLPWEPGHIRVVVRGVCRGAREPARRGHGGMGSADSGGLPSLQPATVTATPTTASTTPRWPGAMPAWTRTASSGAGACASTARLAQRLRWRGSRGPGRVLVGDWAGGRPGLSGPVPPASHHWHQLRALPARLLPGPGPPPGLAPHLPS